MGENQLGLRVVLTQFVIGWSVGPFLVLMDGEEQSMYPFQTRLPRPFVDHFLVCLGNAKSERGKAPFKFRKLLINIPPDSPD